MDAIAPGVTLPPDDSAAQPRKAHHWRLEFEVIARDDANIERRIGHLWRLGSRTKYK
jgi:hypothetical protein